MSSCRERAVGLLITLSVLFCSGSALAQAVAKTATQASTQAPTQAATQAATQAPTQAVAPASAFPGIGRAATPREVAAWDIDVRPDFKGLPKGAGSVAKGMDIWEAKCASCHGVFGESNEVFAPIVGGTTQDDIRTGRVARLNDASFPGRTTLMKLPTLSTLWDYIHRAMPWTQPKTLSADEVYAVTAFILNLGGVVPDEFVLSDQNIAQVQKRMPNRNGMTHAHAMWPGAGLDQAKAGVKSAAASKRPPDVLAKACMSGCAQEPALASFLPDFARDAHGNLAEQSRGVGAQRGADTTRPSAAATTLTAAAAAAPTLAAAAEPKPSAAASMGTVAAAAPGTAAVPALLKKYSCVACHGMENKIVGPSFREVANKQAGRAEASAYLAGKIQGGSAGVWGAIPMPPQALSAGEAKLIAQWLADGMKR